MSARQQNNAPTAGQGDEGDDQNQEGTIMTIIQHNSTKRHIIEVGEDLPVSVYYGENLRGDMLLRMHFRIHRVTARPGVFTVRHFQDATEADRQNALDRVQRIASFETSFARWKAAGATARRRWSADKRSWLEFVLMGTPVDDPLVQLELEMMIDLHSGVNA